MQEFGQGRRSRLGSFIVDARENILGFDEALERLTGWPAVEVVGHGKDLSLASGDDPASMTSIPLYDGRIPMETRPTSFGLALHCRDGRRLEVQTAGRPLNGPGRRMQVTVLRVLASSPVGGTVSATERRDSLTGLLNRDGFASQLSADFLQSTASASPLSLIMLDVDGLRRINDRLGHSAGDEVLRKLAGILRVTVEDERRLARIDGDDFAVLLHKQGRGGSRRVAATLRSTVERFHFLPDELADLPHATISLGAASYPADADNERELVERAREALDEARSMGRNRVWCYLRRPRVPVQVPVYFDGTDPLLLGYTRDLSPSGIFLQTTAGIDVGMRCALAFPLPGHDGKVHVVGRVVRTVQPEIRDDAADLRIPGLGVEFERFGGPSDRRAIDSFLHDRESTSLRPERGRLSIPS